jgi:hypothetical protein
MRLNKVQQRAVYKLYTGNSDGSPSYWHFRHRVFPLIGDASCAMIHYCRMYVGVEPDGYVHS